MIEVLILLMMYPCPVMQPMHEGHCFIISSLRYFVNHRLNSLGLIDWSENICEKAACLSKVYNSPVKRGLSPHQNSNRGKQTFDCWNFWFEYAE